jgi:hypothetical protein
MTDINRNIEGKDTRIHRPLFGQRTRLPGAVPCGGRRVPLPYSSGMARIGFDAHLAAARGGTGR